MTLKHAFVSAKSDSADATIVNASNWNAEHIPDADGIVFTAGSTDPATPASGFLNLYAKLIAGRAMAKWIGPAGVDTPIQPFLGMNHIRSLVVGGAAAATTLYSAIASGYTLTATTYAMVTPTTGSVRSKARMGTQATNATAGQLATLRWNYLECAAETGYFFVARFGIAGTMQAGQRGFFGLWDAVSTPTNIVISTETTRRKVGLGFELNTGNWKLYNSNAAAATVLDLGGSFPLNTTDLIELILYSPPGGTTVQYRVTNLSSGAVASGTLSSNIPVTSTYLAPVMWITNNATAGISTMTVKSIYLETDT
jgi:hypothetical protein